MYPSLLKSIGTTSSASPLVGGLGMVTDVGSTKLVVCAAAASFARLGGYAAWEWLPLLAAWVLAISTLALHTTLRRDIT